MLRTFRLGGIHPPENKISAAAAVTTLAAPNQVAIPISMHIGAPAVPVVSRGDEVKIGTLIAKAGGFISANIHSSISGKVLKIDEVVDASGYKKTAIIIKSDGTDTWEDGIDTSDAIIKECQLAPMDIVKRIADCGIVGMGGATFPTNIKLLPPKDSKPEMIIINAVECEPYLTADHRVMLEHGTEILIGVSILMRAANVNKAAIGIENNKKDAIDHLTSLAKDFPGISIVPLKVKYPQGGEKQLIDAVMKRMIKSGALPISVGAIVQNVGTAYAVYQAVQKNRPLIDRIVTVTGKGLAHPSNIKARIGTPIKDLIEAAGGLPEETSKIINGGPMMGKALVTSDAPVTKGTSGVLLLEKVETKRKPMRNCIRCAKCVNVCPMGLNPAFLMRDVVFSEWDHAEKEHIVDCIECGSCSYTCPSSRPLLDHIRLGKQKVMANIRSRKS